MTSFDPDATPEERLAAMGVELPTKSPSAVISSTKEVGGLGAPSVREASGLVATTHIPSVGSEGRYLGRVGEDLTVDDGYAAARLCTINALADYKLALGELSRINGFFMIMIFVVCTKDFTKHSYVGNGVTDLLKEAFGEEIGRHARATLGIESLAGGHSVETVTWAAL